jgi:ABC-2 type transport system ATP-binding protein
MASDDPNRWWESWAPYWAPLEDRHFGSEALERVSRFVAGPALVVGAGHGVLVESLRRHGLEVEGLDASDTMIAAARQRRGLELVRGDARELPFEDGRFRTVIVASGVVDYQTDQAAVTRILGEALRVLKPWGNLLCGFHRFPPKLERIYRRIGVIEGEQYHAARLFELGEIARRNPFGCVPHIARWTGRGLLPTFFFWANTGVTTLGHFLRESRLVEGVFRLAAKDGVSRRQLLDDVPRTLPYRDEAAVRRLFAGAELPWIDVAPMPDCLVARHQKRETGRPAPAGAGGGEWHIRTEQVRKRYRGASRDAVRSLDLSIDRGQVFGILGPNGAGKTTTLLMLCGLLSPDEGAIRFAGGRHAAAIRARIGLVPQNIAVFQSLSARENLAFFGSLHGLRGHTLRRRTELLLEQIGLSDRADERVDTYSSGMKRRLNLVSGLMHEPEILLLDEPTVGMDPQSRNRVFEIVRALRRRGVTVLYTTHYMEEASRLCDRVAIMDHGSVLVEGSPADLVTQYGTYRVDFEVDRCPPELTRALRTLEPVCDTSEEAGLLSVVTRDAPGAMQVLEQAKALAHEHEVALTLRAVAEASLENVFLHLTGRSMRDEAE